MMMMMMICNDLMCTEKLTRSQLSLSHNAKVKTDMPKENKNSWSPWSKSGGWKELWRKGFVKKMSFEPGVLENTVSRKNVLPYFDYYSANSRISFVFEHNESPVDLSFRIGLAHCKCIQHFYYTNNKETASSSQQTYISVYSIACTAESHKIDVWLCMTVGHCVLQLCIPAIAQNSGTVIPAGQCPILYTTHQLQLRLFSGCN